MQLLAPAWPASSISLWTGSDFQTNDLINPLLQRQNINLWSTITVTFLRDNAGLAAQVHRRQHPLSESSYRITSQRRIRKLTLTTFKDSQPVFTWPTTDLALSVYWCLMQSGYALGRGKRRWSSCTGFLAAWSVQQQWAANNPTTKLTWQIWPFTASKMFQLPQ